MRACRALNGDLCPSRSISLAFSSVGLARQESVAGLRLGWESSRVSSSHSRAGISIRIVDNTNRLASAPENAYGARGTGDRLILPARLMVATLLEVSGPVARSVEIREEVACDPRRTTGGFNANRDVVSGVSLENGLAFHLEMRFRFEKG